MLVDVPDGKRMSRALAVYRFSVHLSLFAQVTNQVQYCVSVAMIEVAGGFIHDDDGRLCNQHASDGHALLAASRLSRAIAQAMAQTHQVSTVYGKLVLGHLYSLYIKMREGACKSSCPGDWRARGRVTPFGATDGDETPLPASPI